MKVADKIDIWKIGERSFNPQETLQVLQHDITVFWSWGVHALRVVPSEKYKGEFVALKFAVNGKLHKGHVYIVLAWDDTYKVYFTTSHGTIKEIKEMVYFDMLVDVIDSYVETK